MKILVTGAAGFIGFYTVKYFAERGDDVVGLDNINDYYDVELKYARIAATGLEKSKIKEGELVTSALYSNYRFIKADLTDKARIDSLFSNREIRCGMQPCCSGRSKVLN